MSYLVFARKYRPQTFDQVVQQDHVTRTLANAIAAGRVSHAILFTGPRGTGKTTVARILAKSMNCAQGPTATPCNQCQSCEEITSGHAADVFEIDGASNNSVDQVRELRENLKYMPAHGRYKIYIIDEVHMLSLAAFNALLKTLEEPPAHVLFIFATTEVHKIPVTILSRCQRHDLRRIEMTAIVEQMRRICDLEKIAIDDAGLSLIAQEAGGSMRDALSLLDHVLTCAADGVSADLVAELLGAVERKHLFELSAAVFARDIQSVLEKIDDVWRHGLEMKRFYSDLVAHFHNLAIVNLGERSGQLVDLPAHEIKLMQTQLKAVPQGFLIQLLDLLLQAEPSIKFSAQPKLALEMVFLKLFQTPPTLPIDTLIDRLDQLRAAGGLTSTPSQPIQAPTAMPSSTPLPRSEPESTLVAPALAPVAPQELKPENPVPANRLWEQAMQRIGTEKPSLAAFLTKCRLTPASEGHWKLEVRGNEFTLKNVQKHSTYLEKICAELAGQSIKLKLEANIEEAVEKQKEKQTADRLRQQALSHPLVAAALEIFNGNIVDVKVSQSD